MSRRPDLRLAALLDTHSYFSLGRGVSSPRVLLETARRLGYRHLALTDNLSTAGAVELHRAAEGTGVSPVVGATLDELHGLSSDLFCLTAGRSGFPRVLLEAGRKNDLLEHLSGLKGLSSTPFPWPKGRGALRKTAPNWTSR